MVWPTQGYKYFWGRGLMQTTQTNHEGATLVLSRAELLLMSNALVEAMQAVDDWEFPLRIGVTWAEAEEFKRELKDCLRRVRES